MSLHTLSPQSGTQPMIGYIQDILARTGFYKAGITYQYDDNTISAVEAFQQRMGLLPDGIIGPSTWESLLPYITGNYTYSVKEGNTLQQIADKAGTTLDSLLAANPLITPEHLFIGQKIIVPFIKYTIPTTILYSSDIMELNLQSLKTRYPFLQWGTTGYSVLGKELPYIRIGHGNKTVFYNASHHANEWITSVLLMKFIETFCYAYVNKEKLSGFDVQNIFDTASIYIMPMVNPDGVDLVTGAIQEDNSAYRFATQISKSYPDIPFPNGWKANIAGTDLNLNYPARWEVARQIKAELGFTSPAPRDYVGPYPFSEPESRAVALLTDTILPKLILAYHAQGEIIYWKFADYNPEGSFEIAKKFSQLSGYTVETTPDASGNAGYKDWFIQQFNLPGYTIEVGKGESPLPLDQFPRIYQDNIGILLSAPLLI